MNDSPAAVIVDAITEETAEIQAGRLKVETPGQLITSDPTAIVRERVSSGGSTDLLIDGSATPTTFTVGAHATLTRKISEIRFVMTADKIEFKGSKFGKEDQLTNGVKLSVFLGGVDTQLTLLQVNEDFLDLYTPTGIFVDTAGKKDAIAVGLFLGGAVELAAGSADEVRVLIQDDLTDGSFQWFRCTITGLQV